MLYTGTDWRELVAQEFTPELLPQEKAGWELDHFEGHFADCGCYQSCPSLATFLLDARLGCG